MVSIHEYWKGETMAKAAVIKIGIEMTPEVLWRIP